MLSQHCKYCRRKRFVSTQKLWNINFLFLSNSQSSSCCRGWQMIDQQNKFEENLRCVFNFRNSMLKNQTCPIYILFFWWKGPGGRAVINKSPEKLCNIMSNIPLFYNRIQSIKLIHRRKLMYVYHSYFRAFKTAL